MSTRKPSDKPLNAQAEKGEVLVDGPDGAANSFTPDAASTSAGRIARAAGKAADQRDEDDKRRDRESD
ncbi:hypothetical protein [Stakelama marina]|uniref:Uncharacterized protein n=1 Tax=Stakelama marina TaxID=2826939 RepID=A0A8T4IEL2_9SPHN|nr:hypothetical protein [Stakelama marina]MBR0553448.1 hypothetical protein [Stakelama marina]